MMWRFQNKQIHHREQQTERIDRDGQRSRPQNAASSGSSNGTSVNSVNNRVSGFSRTRDTRDGEEYTRSEQHLHGKWKTIVISFPWLIPYLEPLNLLNILWILKVALSAKLPCIGFKLCAMGSLSTFSNHPLLNDINNWNSSLCVCEIVVVIIFLQPMNGPISMY